MNRKVELGRICRDFAATTSLVVNDDDDWWRENDSTSHGRYVQIMMAIRRSSGLAGRIVVETMIDIGWLDIVALSRYLSRLFVGQLVVRRGKQRQRQRARHCLVEAGNR